MKKALLVIDVQNIYSDSQYDYYVENSKDVINNINLLIKKFDEAGDMVVYIKHQHNADGKDAGRMFDYEGESSELEFVEGTHCAEYSPELLIIDSAQQIIKHRYDSFSNTGLYKLLCENGIEKVIIVGFMANFCCESTARTAHDLDFYVDFVKDAMGTPGTEIYSQNEIIDFVCDAISSGFGIVKLTQDLL